MNTYTRPVIGKITSKFGERIHPITKKKSFHNGIDIACFVGTPVYCPVTGKVSEVWETKTGGLCMSIVSLENVRFGFAHLSKQINKVGDRVTKGDIIALTGNTGASTGPHLHFTMKILGQWVDPQLYIQF